MAQVSEVGILRPTIKHLSHTQCQNLPPHTPATAAPLPGSRRHPPLVPAHQLVLVQVHRVAGSLQQSLQPGGAAVSGGAAEGGGVQAPAAGGGWIVGSVRVLRVRV